MTAPAVQGADPPVAAVIWDFGGVISSSPFDAFQGFERTHGLPPGFLRDVNAANHLDNAWAKFERSELDLPGFDAAFLAETAARGHPVSGRAVIRLLAGEIRPMMVSALERLRPHVKLGLITNNVRTDDPDETHANERQAVLSIFHHVIESARVGLRKPDPAIYRMMCEALRVVPEQAVFLDDLGVNLKPAREMGMRTIKVTEPTAALRELEAIVGLRLLD